MKKVKGFTLLEILVALAVIAIGVAAIIKSVGGIAGNVQATEERQIGAWVASNRLAELHLARQWPAALTKDHSVIMGGRAWYYREAISTTADPDVLRVDLTVFSDPQHEYRSASLLGYLVRHTPAVAP